MALFEAKLLKDHRGKLVVYGETLTIDSDSTPLAIKSAKAWAKTQDHGGDSWLQVTCNGIECSLMKPGEF
jgi:hypothetical protein